MKEIQEILKKVGEFADDEKAILATVVDVVGSGYRRPGARMLIDKKGFSIGTVSGGCLEADVLERAKKVLETNEPIVITYDTTKDENSVFGLGMGCRGIVRILLEPFGKDSFLYQSFLLPLEMRVSQFVGTMISSNANFFVGGRILYSDFDQFYFQNVPNKVESLEKLTSDCEGFYYQNKLPEMREYKVDKEIFEIFLENINPPVKLLLFGAGYDAIPLIKFAKELGWIVTVIDHRSGYANAERLPEADEIIVANSEDLDEWVFNDGNSVGVIMTHNYERDRNIFTAFASFELPVCRSSGTKSELKTFSGNR